MQTRPLVIAVSMAVLPAIVHAQAGPVLCWGTNNNGELGNDSGANSSTPVAAFYLSGIQAASAGLQHVLALSSDGHVFSWGSNASGQLGMGDFIDRSAPERIPNLDRIIAVSAGGRHSLALRDDGVLFSWGHNGDGQLGIGTTANQPSPVDSGLSFVKSIAAGGDHSLALCQDGRIRATGDNLFGQLGIGNKIDSLVWRTVGTTDSIKAIAAGRFHSVALDYSGRVYCCGANSFGQLADGTPTDRSSFGFSHIGNVRALASGSQALHTLAVRVDGTVACWGRNVEGQLGDGTKTNRFLPATMLGVANAKGVAAGAFHSVILLAGGRAMATGFNFSGELGDGTTTDRTKAVPVLNATFLKSVTAGYMFSAGLKCVAGVKSWGRNDKGQLGIGTLVEKHSPSYMTGFKTGALDVAIGQKFSIILKGDGTVWSTGSNDHGQLGIGSQINQLKPVKIPTLANIIAIAAGFEHAMALAADGRVWAWGANGSFQLGVNDTLPRYSPVVVGYGASDIACGALTSFAIVYGDLWGWGDAQRGELGITSDWARKPTLIPGMIAPIAVAGGSFHTVALDVEGKVWSFGDNPDGQLGLGDTTARFAPVRNLSANAKAVTCGYDHSAYLNAQARVFTTGRNDQGQLGIGNLVSQSTWQLAGLPLAEVSAGAQHVLERISTGYLLAFGSNVYGQLGDGTTINRPSNVTVAGGTYCTRIGRGNGEHSTALFNPPLMMSAMKVTPTSLTGGASAVGTITLSANAGPGGQTVFIVSNNAAATVPHTVEVPAGAKSATFPIATKPVTAVTKVSIKGNLVVDKSAILTINP